MLNIENDDQGRRRRVVHQDDKGGIKSFMFWRWYDNGQLKTYRFKGIKVAITEHYREDGSIIKNEYKRRRR